MSIPRDQVISMTEGEFEDRQQAEFIVAQAVGWQEASVWLMDKAVAEFRRDHVNEADGLKQLAKDAKERSDQLRAEYDKFRKEAGLDKESKPVAAGSIGRRKA